MARINRAAAALRARRKSSQCYGWSGSVTIRLPLLFQSSALPIELPDRDHSVYKLARAIFSRMLYRLSYLGGA